ncbi:hypothetical protein [Bradyrhizobium sp. SZCCHNR1045]|nr:hypothetical protein [Bradyrhizobium sp. SZCCHNR1045]
MPPHRAAREGAGGIIEDLDRMGWSEYCRPLPTRLGRRSVV